jgi:hypothetical protein
MALVRFGNGISEIRGSIAGSTFSRTHAGAVIRNRIKPTNPNTQPQADIRYLFSYVAASYADLSEAERKQWREFAEALTFWKNRLGESYTPTARQVYQYCQTNLILARSALYTTTTATTWQWNFGAMISTPEMDITEKPQPLTFNNGDKSFNLTLNPGGTIGGLISNDSLIPPNAADDLQNVIVEATAPIRRSQGAKDTRFRYLQGYNASAATQLDLLTEYNSLFGNPAGLATGDKIIIRISTVNKNGLRSDPTEITAIA